MPDLNTTVKFEPTEKFGKLLEEAKADFKRIHTELTDDMKALIAEEVKRQLEARHITLVQGEVKEFTFHDR